MAVSLAAGALLGLTGVEIAKIFAWVGVGAVVVIFVKLITSVIDGLTTVQRVKLSEEDFEKLFEDINEGE